MSGDDDRPPADDSAPGDGAEGRPDDSPTGGSDSGGGRSDDEGRPGGDAPDSDDGHGSGGASSHGSDGAGGHRSGGAGGGDGRDSTDDAAPNGGRFGGADDAGDAGTAVGDDGTDAAADRGPTPTRARRTDRSEESLLDRFLHAEQGPFLLLREVLSSVGAVVAVGLILFAVSGVWPPMVAVESGSMEPHMTRGDLVFITTEGRFMSDDATLEDTGVVTAAHGEEIDYRSFGGYGSVVVYDDPGRVGPPVIHRAHFWVADGENWYDQANPEYVNADSCDELRNCPAPHAGFITKGDANPSYDQAMDISEPVRPEWINGVARVRVPFLGWIRLLFSEGFAAVLDSPGATAHVPAEAAWSGGGSDARAPAVGAGVDVRSPAVRGADVGAGVDVNANAHVGDAGVGDAGVNDADVNVDVDAHVNPNTAVRVNASPDVSPPVSTPTDARAAA